MKESLKPFLRVFFTLLFIGLLIYGFRNSLGEVWQILLGANKGLLALLALAFLGVHFLFGYRLKLILDVQEVSISAKDSYALILAGTFFNNFLPSVVGGDLAKSIYLARFTNNKYKESLSSIFLDRLIGVTTLFATGVVFLLFNSTIIDDPRVKYSFIGISIVGILAVLFLFSSKFADRFKFLGRIIPFEKAKNFLAELYFAVHNYKKHPNVLLGAFLISVLAHLITITIIYYLSHVLYLKIPFVLMFIVFPLINFSALAPSINGLGAREALFVFYMGAYATAEGALAISLLLELLLFFLGFVGGIFVAFKGKIELQEIKNISEDTKFS